jgi:hypothetical protein
MLSSEFLDKAILIRLQIVKQVNIPPDDAADSAINTAKPKTLTYKYVISNVTIADCECE